MVWASRLQILTSQSTTEAEFISLAHCVREIHWIRATMAELNVYQAAPTVHQDNLGATCWTNEVQGLHKVKHIGIFYQYVLNAVDSKTVQVHYIASTENTADGLTNVLVTANFYKIFSGLLCLRNVQLLPIEEAC